MPFPIIPLITAAASLGSSAVKARKAKQAEKELEASLNNTPKYRQNQSILNYYDAALRKYQTSPTDTAEYKRDVRDIKQGTVQGLSSLNKLRSGNVANIIQGQNNSLLNAAIKAESKKPQEFSVVGQAAGMKTGEDKAAFSQNELYPFEGKYNLMSMKAAGRRADQRQSSQNAYNNISAAAAILADKDGGSEGLMNVLGSIFGSKGQRSEIRWNKGGQQWWQN
jgi:hypothetical protein